MPIILIDSPQDPRLDRYADLRTDPTRHASSDSFVIEGRWCVEQLAASHCETLSVVVERGRESEVAAWLDDQVPIYSLCGEHVRQLVGYDFHRGFLACGRRPGLASIDDLKFHHTAARDGDSAARMVEPALALAVLGVSQRDNLGSMIRTATALGIRRLLIGSKTADPYSRRAIRVSMATVFQQRIYQLDQPVAQLRQLSRSRGFRTVVATLGGGAIPLDQFKHDDRPVVLIVGNEADGVAPEIEAEATDRVTIPMQQGTDSLNVSVAAAIFMYEMVRSK